MKDISALAFTWLISCCTTLLLAPPGRSDDQLVRAEFLQQYKDHAQAVQDYYTNVRAKCTRTYDFGNGKAQVSRLEVKYNRWRYLIRCGDKVIDKGKPDDPSKPLGMSIDGQNPDYHFRLKPLGGDQYLLTDFDPRQEAKPTELSFLTVPFADFSRSRAFLEMAERGDGQFLDFKDSTWQDRAVKELKVRFVSSEGQQKSDYTVSYYFAPEDGWVCCGRRSHLANDPPSKSYEEIYSYGPKNTGRFAGPARTLGNLGRLAPLRSASYTGLRKSFLHPPERQSCRRHSTSAWTR
jgi:hypothetical protein